MTDALGDRAVFSVLIPATNSIVEPDLAAMQLEGVTLQTFRFPFPGMPGSFDALLDMIAPTLGMMDECEPEAAIIGYTTEFLPDGIAAADKLRRFIAERTGLRLAMASEAVPAAIRAFGAKRIGIVTPYLPEADRNVADFFTALGFSVAAVAGLESKGRVATARIAHAAVRGAFARVDDPTVEVLVQVGTNLVCADIVPELEARHGKPVVAVNPASYWAALRLVGITDRLPAMGRLLGGH
ncbi:MAG: arylmalonate decarboxylase [Alphaproteobacteria bacterium]|nr:arylmalonate decarboxylase [Alphaproteobacteria bacterium]